MPHKCVRCNIMYPSGSEVLLKGCTQCHGRFFFFVRDEFQQEAEVIIKQLTAEDKRKIEADVKEIIGNVEEDKPIILDIETIRILNPGSYELDLVGMFKGKPLVYRLEDGKYFIDIDSTFKAKDFSEKKSPLDETKERSEDVY